MDMLLLDAPTCTQILDADMDMGSFSATDSVIQSLDPGASSTYSESYKLEFSEDDNLKSRKRSPVRHQCSKCDKSFTGKVYLNLHEKLHVGRDDGKTDSETTNVAIFAPTNKKIKKKRSYKCSKCETRYSSPYHLSVHVRSHDEKPIKNYVCQICGRSYVAPQHLKSHMFSHSDERPYKCDLCEKSFTGKCYLLLHNRLHTNEKKNKCTLCDNSFISSSHLKLHMDKHRQLKEFKCNLCDRDFVSKIALERHKKKCSLNKVSICKVCKRKVHSDSLKRHYKDYHQRTIERPHKCKECDQTFILMLNLNLHLKVHHGIERDNKCNNEN